MIVFTTICSFHILIRFSMSICRTVRFVVEMMGFEPMTPCLQGRCSPSWATPPYWMVRSYFSYLVRIEDWASPSLSCLAYLSRSLLRSRFASCSFDRLHLPFWKGARSRKARGSLLIFTLAKPFSFVVGPSGLEPPTSCLSGTRSNLLSYEPMWLVWRFTLRCLDSRKADCSALLSLCQHRTIFPHSFPWSIVATAELNFCVRNGNRWTLCV